MVVLALLIAIVVFGFVLAPKAGRGSGEAKRWWIVIIALESLYVFSSRARFPFALVAPAIIAGQVALFFYARKEAGR